jgi:hypothetical protein
VVSCTRTHLHPQRTPLVLHQWHQQRPTAKLVRVACQRLPGGHAAGRSRRGRSRRAAGARRRPARRRRGSGRRVLRPAGAAAGCGRGQGLGDGEVDHEGAVYDPGVEVHLEGAAGCK